MTTNYFDYFLSKLVVGQTKLGRDKKEHVSSESSKKDFESQPNIQGRSPGLRKREGKSFSGAVSLN